MPPVPDTDRTRPFSAESRDETAALLTKALHLGLDFKLQAEVFRERVPSAVARDRLVTELPEGPASVETALAEFTDTMLPLCKNEASPQFLGFGDTGDDVGALTGGVLALLTQQNLINQSFDSPSGTFVETTVLRWLRELIGFTNPPVDRLKTVFDVGGIITHGGTMSNSLAMMLAREHKVPGTMEHGVRDPGQYAIVVPRDIGHYSVKSALKWIGLGYQVIEVDTDGFRYDLKALERALREHAGRVMSVVAYAGDSRTQTVDDLRGVRDVVRAADASIWLHADACWGLLCAFSDELRGLIEGIADYDSVTVDPHKVMGVPHSLGAVLVRDPESLRAISSHSGLIMGDDFDFGQVTPFVGTKAWLSLKLWMMMRTRGRSGLAHLAEDRVATARRFADLVDARERLVRLHPVDMMAVTFLYVPADVDVTAPDIERINEANLRIHERMLTDGTWHLHHFGLPDDTGVLKHGATLYPMRFMAANPRIEEQHMTGVLDYVLELGALFDKGEL
ncbi:pyridoxal phosphate-dependent decarboxylase family protein [Streptomyces sp. NRRL B-1347]|uniref:pyridoxal phosphate-dependent decarboxylase family protein n=1 Tax=Streptomyces sp. NRRL B-1347 TaxID=1476877 RepID=UPI0007C5CEF6|nr:pyridoxal-dependent decarboxylase [Streptomyces sp. NRRL B-1347]